MKIGPNVMGKVIVSEEELAETYKEYSSLIFPTLEKNMQKYSFQCCDDISLADIVIYNDLVTILSLFKQ
jgi:hypothetical protein